MTTVTRAEEFVRRQESAWNSHDVARIAADYATNAVVRDPAYPEPLKGTEAVKKDASDFFAAFPDLKVQVKKFIADGDTIAMEGAASGTHTGPLPLPTGLIPATNRRLEFQIGIFMTLDASGKITEERRYYDLAGQMAQLGLMQ
jgi:steroid delta-isomerase-like uncharacterized protein